MERIDLYDIWVIFVETKGLALEEVDDLFDGFIHADGVFIGNGECCEQQGDTTSWTALFSP